MVQQLLSWDEVSRDEMARRAADLHFERYGDRWNAFGEQAKEKCFQDTCYHLDYLSEALLANSPTIFIEYVEWAQTMLSSRGISSDDLKLNLSILREVLDEELPGESSVSALACLD